MRINETRKRSLLKSLTQRIFEIIVDTLILSFFIDSHIALGLAVFIEFLCWISHYINERLWNKIDYGREVMPYKDRLWHKEHMRLKRKLLKSMPKSGVVTPSTLHGNVIYDD